MLSDPYLRTQIQEWMRNLLTRQKEAKTRVATLTLKGHVLF